MSRKRQSNGPHVQVPLVLLDAPAWRAMSVGAQMLHITLRRRLRNDRLNNGRIFESCRAAAEKIGVDKKAVGRWYHELEHFGFIRKTAPGFLGSDGCGIATRYRFTDLAHGTHPPTRDYEKWDGAPFVYTPRRPTRKKPNPVPPKGTPRPPKGDIRKASGKGAVCPPKGDINRAPKCPPKGDISRLPFPAAALAAAVAMDQGSSTARAPAQAGGAGSSPAPDAKPDLTAMVLAIVNEQLDELELRRSGLIENVAE
jgi:hypothetical protein